jgi:hypothetical protein
MVFYLVVYIIANSFYLVGTNTKRAKTILPGNIFIRIIFEMFLLVAFNRFHNISN